jgi:hypothetical protein
MKLYRKNRSYSDTHFNEFDESIKYLYDCVKEDWRLVREYSKRPEYEDKKQRTRFETYGYTYRDRANIYLIMNPLSEIRVIIDLGVVVFENYHCKTYSIHVYPRLSKETYTDHNGMTKHSFIVPRITKKMKVKLGSIHR